MNIDYVHDVLKDWGELELLTDAGMVAELHLGDVDFDSDGGVLSFEDADGARHYIDDASIEDVETHRSHVVSKP